MCENMNNQELLNAFTIVQHWTLVQKVQHCINLMTVSNPATPNPLQKHPDSGVFNNNVGEGVVGEESYASTSSGTGSVEKSKRANRKSVFFIENILENNVVKDNTLSASLIQDDSGVNLSYQSVTDQPGSSVGGDLKEELPNAATSTHKQGSSVHCKYCQRSFSKKNGLIAHLRIHTGEKPFKCDICGKEFADGSNCRAHRQTHQEKQFECSKCHRLFALKSYLQKHKPSACHKYLMKCAKKLEGNKTNDTSSISAE